MKAPIRVQRKRSKGYKLPENTKSVTRPGPFGNPYKVGDPHIKSSRDAVIAYSNWTWRTAEGIALSRRARAELRGFNLACYCALGAPCHADVLLKIANSEEPEESK